MGLKKVSLETEKGVRVMVEKKERITGVGLVIEFHIKIFFLFPQKGKVLQRRVRDHSNKVEEKPVKCRMMKTKRIKRMCI